MYKRKRDWYRLLGGLKLGALEVSEGLALMRLGWSMGRPTDGLLGTKAYN